MMQRSLSRSLPYVVPVTITVALWLLSQQLRVQHLLAELYLFWGYVGLVLIAALAAWTIAAKAKGPAVLALLVVSISLALPWWQDHLRNGPAGGPTLQVATFNWLGDPHDRSAAYAWIARERPDILAIEEFDVRTAPDAPARLYPLYPYHSRPMGDVMLLSKYPIARQDMLRLGRRVDPMVVLDVDGRPLSVYGIHPPTLRNLSELAGRNAYLADLADLMSSSTPPMLMMGDFNATRWEPALHAVVARGHLHEEPRLVPLATRMGVRSHLPFLGAPIDHIFSNGHNRLSGCHTGPSLGSDHLPLICRFQFVD